MTTTAGLVEAVAAATCAPKSDVAQRVRALREAGLIPTAPDNRSPPHITPRHAVLALLATLRGGPIKHTVEHAASYAALREEDEVDYSLAWLIEAEMEELRAGQSEFIELLMIEEPLAASMRFNDGWIRFNDDDPVRYATRLISFPRAGLEKLARALD